MFFVFANCVTCLCVNIKQRGGRGGGHAAPGDSGGPTAAGCLGPSAVVPEEDPTLFCPFERCVSDSSELLVMMTGVGIGFRRRAEGCRGQIAQDIHPHTTIHHRTQPYTNAHNHTCSPSAHGHTTALHPCSASAHGRSRGLENGIVHSGGCRRVTIIHQPYTTLHHPTPPYTTIHHHTPPYVHQHTC